MRLLLIEDDVRLASFLKKGLSEHGFAMDHAQDGAEGLHYGLHEEYDVVIVDIMLPQMDGFTVVERLRNAKPTLPILILSAKRAVEERVKGLMTGSDDYLTKPFAFVELLARIHALMRRSHYSPSSHRLKVADLELDTLTHTVTRAGKKLDLSPKEFSILEYLMRHVGEVVSRTMLMEHVWDFQFDPGTNVVDVHICRLREKINRGCELKLLTTIRGVGYVIKAPS